MENFGLNTVEVVDMSELCNLLIDNGYRLVRWSGEGADSCCIAAADPILEREMKAAQRRAELARLEADVQNTALLGALRAWRQERAKADDVPTYFIMNNKSMLFTALKAPASMEDLLAIDGFGPNKAEKYGAEILAIVAREMEVAG